MRKFVLSVLAAVGLALSATGSVEAQSVGSGMMSGPVSGRPKAPVTQVIRPAPSPRVAAPGRNSIDPTVTGSIGQKKSGN